MYYLLLRGFFAIYKSPKTIIISIISKQKTPFFFFYKTLKKKKSFINQLY